MDTRTGRMCSGKVWNEVNWKVILVLLVLSNRLSTWVDPTTLPSRKRDRSTSDPDERGTPERWTKEVHLKGRPSFWRIYRWVPMIFPFIPVYKNFESGSKPYYIMTWDNQFHTVSGWVKVTPSSDIVLYLWLSTLSNSSRLETCGGWCQTLVKEPLFRESRHRWEY